MKTKHCPYCKKIKSIDNFHNSSIRKSGKESYCKKCRKLQAIKFKDRINLYHRKWNKLNKDKKRKNSLKWLKKNPSYSVIYHKNRKKVDINFKLRCNLAARFGSVLNYNLKSKRTIELLGCSIEKFKQHIESQFTNGMTWENYGKFGWHIDHIKPCISFDFSNPKQQEQCFHYTNLQPLWWYDNLSKGAKT